MSQVGWSGMVRFHHTTQNDVQFKNYQVFILGSFHSIFSDCSYLKLENETTDKGGLLYSFLEGKPMKVKSLFGSFLNAQDQKEYLSTGSS